MPRFDANLTMLFGEVDFLDRFEAAAKAGFAGVEYLSPYEYDKRALRQRLDDHGLTQVLHNVPSGNWGAGERGIACHPGRQQEFAEGVDKAIEYATVLGCARVNCLAGILPAGVEPRAARQTLIENLARAAERLRPLGIKLLIEPINTRDIPGFFLTRTDQALEIIAEVGADNLFVQYDIYHAQIMEGDLAMRITNHLPQIAHMQVADTPGRHEPGTGEINYDFLFGAIDAAGYQGWIGCEYKPAGSTLEGLTWFKRWRRAGVTV
jgi:hydroxypyruvate isomerase